MIQNREYFQGNPVKLDVSRSKFPLNHKFTTTCNAGSLYPCLAYSDVLPGDTFKLDMSFVCRSTTPVAPVMDDAEIQVEFYFVPHKLVLSRSYMSPSINDKNHSFEAWIGAQDSLLNMPLPEEVLMPSVYVTGSTGIGDYFKSSLLAQLGYPKVGVSDNSTSGRDEFLSPLPLLAYYAVYNEYYRDPNLWSPVVFSITADATSPTGAWVSFADNPIAGIPSGHTGADQFAPAAVARYHGYFGSCLPWPQRNSTAVSLPLGEWAPVFALKTNPINPPGWSPFPTDIHSLIWTKKDGTFETSNSVLGKSNSDGQTIALADNNNTSSGVVLTPRNLYADLRNVVGPSVNTLRLAIQTQRLYEAWARGGNRIQDMTAVFGVVPHDMGDDRPEFLGGKRIPLNVTQVNNTAGTSVSTSTQMSIGSTGAFSNTSDTSHYFTKSFDTWGTLIGVYCIRHKDTFPNMLPKMLSRKTRMDVYWPQFANLGEQPVLKKELEYSSSGTMGTNQDVFGYQEAYADYRYLPDRVSGAVNPLANAGVDYWTYSLTNLTATQRTLSGFLDARDQKGEFDQTLQVSASTAGFQFLIQFYFDIEAVRPMPLYSIPGLMDHH